MLNKWKTIREGRYISLVTRGCTAFGSWENTREVNWWKIQEAGGILENWSWENIPKEAGEHSRSWGNTRKAGATLEKLGKYSRSWGNAPSTALWNSDRHSDGFGACLSRLSWNCHTADFQTSLCLFIYWPPWSRRLFARLHKRWL